MSPRELRLLAQDAEDLEIISAALQDAVLRIGDIQWESAPGRLTLSFNRFRWETEEPSERIRAALQLGAVTRVRSRNLRRDATDAVVELLAVRFEPADAPGGEIILTFADGADLSATVECVDAVLVDLSAPWPAPRAPRHD